MGISLGLACPPRPQQAPLRALAREDQQRKAVMAIYALLAIWTLAPIICAYILRRKQVKFSTIWALLSGFLGPIAIPLALTAKQPNLD